MDNQDVKNRVLLDEVESEDQNNRGLYTCPYCGHQTTYESHVRGHGRLIACPNCGTRYNI